MIRKLRYLNWNILIPYIILVITGVVLVYSASSYILLINGFNPATYGMKQAMYAVMAFVIGAFIFSLKLNVFKNKKTIMWALVISLALLGFLVILKIFKGEAAAVNGAVGWINLGFMNLQPVEVAKLGLVLYLAFVLDKRDGTLISGQIWENLMHPLILTGLMMMLVIVEPDFGGTAILFLIAFVMVLVSGIPTKIALKMLLALALFVIGGFCLIIWWNPKFLQEKYQFQRLLAFLHPFKLEKDAGAQLVNSYYAIHNGGLFGVGLGNSMQKKGYLPEPYTDFILSVTAEEIGVVGAIIILFVLFYLMWQIMEVGVHAESQFNALVCYGIMTIILSETVFNVGALLGLLPITGVTLPFISYGGSSMIILTICIGLVLNSSSNEKIRKIAKEG